MSRWLDCASASQTAGAEEAVAGQIVEEEVDKSVVVIKSP